MHTHIDKPYFQAILSTEVVKYIDCTSAEWYDTKPSDGEAPVHELCGMWSSS